MPQYLLLRAITDEQARALRDGVISTDDLINPSAPAGIRYEGLSVVGCTIAILATFMVGPYLGDRFGWPAFVATMIAGLLVTILMMAIQQRLNSRPTAPPEEIDPKFIVPDDREFGSEYWDALHFALSGRTLDQTANSGTDQPWQPLEFLMRSGEDLPSGHVEECESIISHAEVLKIDKALCELPSGDIEKRVANLTDEIPGADWTDSENRARLRDDLERLKQFVNRSAADGRLLLTSIG